MQKYINEIEKIWLSLGKLEKDSGEFVTAAGLVSEVMEALDDGRARVAEKIDGAWRVNQWARKAILLSFKLRGSSIMTGGYSACYDKIAPKFPLLPSDLIGGSKEEGVTPASQDPRIESEESPRKARGTSEEYFAERNIRIVPGAYVRKGAYIGKNVVLMPSFVNIGAYIDDGCMIDTWSTIGSCAQIGKNCHISGGVGIGGVLEPIGASPVIIEDGCFIGARSEIAEGVVVEEGSVIAMGVYLGSSTKIFNRMTGEVTYGRVPAYSVVVPGSLRSQGDLSLYCAVIVKQVDAATRAKTTINELLR